MIYKFRQFNEQISNLAKTRKFPDFYSLYDLKKDELGKYLNTWFVGKQTKASDLDSYKHKVKNSTIEDFIIRDEMWTFKKTDKTTSNKLYNRRFNPINLAINCPLGGKFTKDESGQLLYTMYVAIKSIDDASYTIWFMGKPLTELQEIRTKLMSWLNTQVIVNGDEFMEVCIEMGADKEQLHYD